MTPNLLPLYMFSVASISLLALFARRNKRTGWVKPRTTFVDDLRALQQAWEEESERVISPVPMGQPAPSMNDIGSFTSQLAKLHGALGNSAAVVVGESKESLVAVTK